MAVTRDSQYEIDNLAGIDDNASAADPQCKPSQASLAANLLTMKGS